MLVGFLKDDSHSLGWEQLTNNEAEPPHFTNERTKAHRT